MADSRWWGIPLILFGLFFARTTYTGFRDGNTTMSPIAPAHRDKNPISFWYFGCIQIGYTALGLVGGAFALGFGR